MKPQNILFLICHDLGTHLGCYGVATVASPHLDQLAAEGVRFSNNFCTAPQCSPSRAAIATGRYPHSVGMLGLAHAPFGWQLYPDERHIATVLRAAGFRTALAGIQHLTDHPASLGFDTVAPGWLCDEVADQACHLLGALAAERTPFYLEVGFFETHRPFDHGGVAPDESHGVCIPPYLPDNAAARQEFAALQGAVRKVDAAIGRILQALDQYGLRENTLVVFTADHGIAFWRAKCSLYDPGLRTALLIRTPKACPRVCESLISNVDLFPTLLEAVGQTPPDNVHGQSFVAELTSGKCAARRYIFAEKTYHNLYDPMRAIRTERYKYILNFEPNLSVETPADAMRGPLYAVMANDCAGFKHAPVELYDLDQDPWEQTNCAGRAEYADIEEDLRRKLAEWMVETQDPLLDGPPPSPFYRAARRLLLEG